MPDLIVHPAYGLDTNPGTIDRPLQTATKALGLLGDQPGEVLLLPGQHSQIVDTRRRTNGPVTVRSMPGATVAGVAVRGATDLILPHLTSTQTVEIDYSPSGDRLAKPAERISFPGVLDVTSSGACMRIINRSQEIDVEIAHFHDAGMGLVMPGRVDTRYISEQIRFGHLRVERMRVDGIQVGWVRDLSIESGFLPGLPAGETDPLLHPDSFQFYGHCYGVQIRNVKALGSRSHSIIAQTDAGPSHGLVVEDCQFGENSAITIQVLGVTGSEIRRIAASGSQHGAIRYAKGAKAPAPTDAILQDCILHADNGRPVSLLDGAVIANDWRSTNLLLPA